jgi:DNA polymerase III subunit gamma/tau
VNRPALNAILAGGETLPTAGGVSYQVFARKYRPQTFADVLGQDHVVRTLRNAIAQNRLAHAYLFVGPRGTGKTSTARIFAKALCCKGGPNIDFDPNDELSIEIAEGRCMDVLEIDGASNNGVEQVRELRDNVKFAPTRCSYKIYYIDEVHMLTTGAFNALLKTLEEPPPHVKFIFATTEPNKILPTIISRCQRFDLRRIPNAIIASAAAWNMSSVQRNMMIMLRRLRNPTSPQVKSSALTSRAALTVCESVTASMAVNGISGSRFTRHLPFHRLHRRR